MAALVAAAPAMAAKSRADLTETAVKTNVTSVLEGGTLEVTDSAKNRGRAKSGRSAAAVSSG